MYFKCLNIKFNCENSISLIRHLMYKFIGNCNNNCPVLIAIKVKLCVYNMFNLYIDKRVINCNATHVITII